MCCCATHAMAAHRRHSGNPERCFTAGSVTPALLLTPSHVCGGVPARRRPALFKSYTSAWDAPSRYPNPTRSALGHACSFSIAFSGSERTSGMVEPAIRWNSDRISDADLRNGAKQPRDVIAAGALIWAGHMSGPIWPGCAGDVCRARQDRRGRRASTRRQGGAGRGRAGRACAGCCTPRRRTRGSGGRARCQRRPSRPPSRGSA